MCEKLNKSERDTDDTCQPAADAGRGRRWMGRAVESVVPWAASRRRRRRGGRRSESSYREDSGWDI